MSETANAQKSNPLQIPLANTEQRSFHVYNILHNRTTNIYIFLPIKEISIKNAESIYGAVHRASYSTGI